MSSKILVLGSSNVDFILRIPYFHEPGETLQSEDVVTVFGGKGANQAIAAKRLGAKVCFATKLGDDHYGDTYRWYLMKNGLDGKYFLRGKELTTGMAFIELNPKGQNRIIVSPGANGSFSEKDLKNLNPLWKDVSVFVTQLEIPLTTVRTGLKMAKKQGAITVLNPAPATRLSSEFLDQVDFLVPNELEAQVLSGIKMKSFHDLTKIGDKLLSLGSKNVVITLGSKGLYFKNEEQELRMRAFRVEAVDSTAAGDAFVGALAWCLSKGTPIKRALTIASGAGALATMKLGAQPSLPLRKELERFLSKIVRGKS
jgi:ribokinase